MKGIVVSAETVMLNNGNAGQYKCIVATKDVKLIKTTGKTKVIFCDKNVEVSAPKSTKVYRGNWVIRSGEFYNADAIHPVMIDINNIYPQDLRQVGLEELHSFENKADNFFGKLQDKKLPPKITIDEFLAAQRKIKSVAQESKVAGK